MLTEKWTEKWRLKTQTWLPVVTSALFAGSFIAGKYAVVELGPLTTSFFRYVVTLVFLSGLLWHFGTASLKVKAADLWRLMLLGSFGIVGYHYFFFSSLQHTDVANTAIINAFSPVVSGIMAALFIKERLRRRSYGGGAIALIGVLMLLTKGNLDNLLQLQFKLGDLLMLCAVLCWTVYALLIKQLSARYSGFTITYYATLFGVVQLLFFAIAENWGTALHGASSAAILSVFYMGIGASGIGYLLYNLSIKTLGPTAIASSVYSLVPVFVSILALLFFQQPITAVMLASMGLIIVGLWVMLGKSS
ncbi:MAG TPA: DMT family transporter [Chroococcidiopsis sp.]